MNKGLFTIIALGAVALSGCSSTDNATASKLDELTNQVSQLSTQVDSLKNEQMSLSDKVDQTAASAQAAQESAQRANDRIDHIAQSYKK
jgi:murein lipoprotein